MSCKNKFLSDLYRVEVYLICSLGLVTERNWDSEAAWQRGSVTATIASRTTWNTYISRPRLLSNLGFYRSTMATHQHNDRKRPRTDCKNKKNIKVTDGPTSKEMELDAWLSWEYPSEFYDKLSRVFLTSRALKEHNRRFKLRDPPPCPSPPSPLQTSAFTAGGNLRDGLARFSRHGGPDLSDLRGVGWHTTWVHLTLNRITIGGLPTLTNPIQYRVPLMDNHQSTDPSTTPYTMTTSKTKKSTPYDGNFENHLTDHHVRPIYLSQEPNLEEVRKAMAIPRPSLSLSKLSGRAFKTFRETQERAKDEADVQANVIPTIIGPSDNAHPIGRTTLFSNLEPLIDAPLVLAKPDIYYGSYPEELSRTVRNELGHRLIPGSIQDKPLAPNFFLEVKGPMGKLTVAKRQARYYGAIGARAIHSLQNYRENKPLYNGKPYAFSSIYCGSSLQLYAHHVTAPETEGGLLGYHMTMIDGWEMTGNIDSFRRGATAFRNLRDLAKRYRDGFIQAANKRLENGRGNYSALQVRGKPPVHGSNAAQFD